MPLRSRAFRRFHTDRVIANRIAKAKALCWWEEPGWVPIGGRLADHQTYVGCNTPGCCACRPNKCPGNGDRTRAEREWKRIEGLD